MNCPNIEEIIRFASQSPTESDVNLAAHIKNCENCQEKFIFATDIVHCEYDITEADIADANAVLEKKVKLSILSEIVTFLDDNLKKMPMISLSSIKIPHLQRASVTTFASSGKTKLHAGKNLPQITFGSVESLASIHYWHAELLLPMILHEASYIQIGVVDKDKKAIDDAVLTIGGVSIKISQGRGSLSFRDFKKSTDGREIILKFSDGYKSLGVIELQ